MVQRYAPNSLTARRDCKAVGSVVAVAGHANYELTLPAFSLPLFRQKILSKECRDLGGGRGGRGLPRSRCRGPHAQFEKPHGTRSGAYTVTDGVWPPLDQQMRPGTADEHPANGRMRDLKN